MQHVDMVQLDLVIDRSAPRETSLRVVAADHPALARDVDDFLDELRSEPRFFGPTARANPKPFPSLIDALGHRDGIRLAALDGPDVIGVVRIDTDGDVLMAVRADRRGDGVGTALGQVALRRAIDLGYRRLVMRSTQRSRAARRIGEALGCTVVDVGRGRTELIIDLAATSDIA